jgi:hypothetical protein
MILDGLEIPIFFVIDSSLAQIENFTNDDDDDDDNISSQQMILSNNK